MARTHYLSQFTPQQLRAAIALNARLTAYKNAEGELQKAAANARARLAARPFFMEATFGAPEGTAQAFLEQMAHLHGLYFKAQQEALDAAMQGLADLPQRWAALQPELQDNADILGALWAYTESYRLEPVVYDDLPAAENAAEGVIALEEAVAAELAQVEALLRDSRPELLQRYNFRRAKETLELNFGIDVFEALDNLICVRTILALLRAEATKPVEA